MLTLKYISDYHSITQFEPIEIEDFSVLTGLNGSGKTQLLLSLTEGHSEVSGIDKSEMIYYNYNDFMVKTDAKQQDHTLHKHLYTASQGQQYFIKKFEGAIRSIQKIKTPTNSLDEIIYRWILDPSFDFNTYFENDFKILTKVEDKERLYVPAGTPIYARQFGFSDSFASMVREYLIHRGGKLEDLQHKQFRQRTIRILTEMEDGLKQSDPDYYFYLKSFVPEESIFSIDKDNFDSPIFILEQITQEEKDYQYLRTENSLKKLRTTDWGSDEEYLEKHEFIEKFGYSPIAQINEVLTEYDCNGYFLTNNSFAPPLGVSKEQASLTISLMHRQRGYQTSFEQLSSGEKTLIGLSLLIYKLRQKRILPRLLLLDEIDSSLHPSMIKRLLSVIQEIFVNKQKLKVILATHSPSTVALSPDNSILLMSRTEQTEIKHIDKAAAINFLSEGFISLNQQDSTLSIDYNISKTPLPVVLTEGITDKIILETAWEKLKPGQSCPFYIQDCFDASYLGNLLRRGNNTPDGVFITHPDKIFIALFDFDKAGYEAWNGVKKNFTVINENDPIKGLTRSLPGSNVYATLLPVPDSPPIKDQVIKSNGETYNDASVLTIELLFYGIPSLNRYFHKVQVLGGGEIIIFRGDKRDFAKSLDNIDAADFGGIKPLFDKILELLPKIS